VRTPPPIDGRLIHEFQVRLMYQGRRLKRYPLRFFPEETAGQVSQLLIDGRKQAIDCRPIPHFEVAQEISYLRRLAQSHCRSLPWRRFAAPPSDYLILKTGQSLRA
jgi:hypothetical protein